MGLQDGLKQGAPVRGVGAVESAREAVRVSPRVLAVGLRGSLGDMTQAEEKECFIV